MVFTGSYSINILKTNLWDVQKRSQYTYLKNILVGCSEEVTVYTS